MARRMVALAGAASALWGCADQARISLFDDVVIDAGVALPDEPPFEPPPFEPPPSVIEDAAVAVRDASEVDELAVTSAPLVLRYDFEGTGSEVEDRVGQAHAIVRGGAELDAQGGLSLDGIDDYVDMPNGLLSSRRSVTIIAWLRWSGGHCWQRVFDFGSTDTGEDHVGNATTSLFLTTASCPDQVVTSMTERNADKQPIAAGRGFPTDRTIQVALTLDGDNGQSALYLDGVREATAPNAHLMSDLNDVNNWLGRSQWVQDGFLNGRYEELRIYDGALTDAELAMLAERGADRP